MTMYPKGNNAKPVGGLHKHILIGLFVNNPCAPCVIVLLLHVFFQLCGLWM